jgi:hypothetical protein
MGEWMNINIYWYNMPKIYQYVKKNTHTIYRKLFYTHTADRQAVQNQLKIRKTTYSIALPLIQCLPQSKVGRYTIPVFKKTEIGSL